MATINLKPTTPSRRGQVRIKRTHLHKGRPHKSLVMSQKKTGGRNNMGRITCRHHGGGSKQLYRVIDFKRDKLEVPGIVERLEYDPNRTAHIALVVYADGERRYIVAPKDIQAGSKICAGNHVDILPGNCLPLSNIPLGALIHCVELTPGKGAQLARSAGSSVQLVAKEGSYVTIRLRSGEMRKVLANCRASIGEVGNSEHNLENLGKAGASRWRGKRPTVRGVAMNPVDHPHGGGEGRTSGGRHPVSPWGVPTKGYRTRKRKHRTDKYIVRRRKKSD